MRTVTHKLPNYFVSFRFLLNYHPATDPIQLGSVLDQRITALENVAVRHIVFLANVYSLCVCLAYVFASVFINRTFRKILASCLLSILRKDNSFGRGGVGWVEREDQKAKQIVVHQTTCECSSFKFSKTSNRFI